MVHLAGIYTDEDYAGRVLHTTAFNKGYFMDYYTDRKCGTNKLAGCIGIISSKYGETEIPWI